MRELHVDQLTKAVRALFLDASYVIGEDVKEALTKAHQDEPSPVGQEVLRQILENNEIAATEHVAICQDTGFSVLFVDLGQDVHLVGGDFETALQEGVRQAYLEGYLRKSIVKDPLFDRKNTGDNTPAVIHTRIVPGDKVSIRAVAKGFGSENMSRLKMMMPADGVEGFKAFVLETVRLAGPNPCPPIILGIGVGGSFEKAAQMAKLATALPLTRHHEDPRYQALEDELLEKINKTGIGPSGTGGRHTALKVHILDAPTHIAGLPIAVNICCHAARHAQLTL